MSFGERLRELRVIRGYSQAQLAEHASLDSGYLSRVERGRYNPPKVSTIRRISQALQLSKEEEAELIGLSGRVKPTQATSESAKLLANHVAPKTGATQLQHISETGSNDPLPNNSRKLYQWARTFRRAGDSKEAHRYLTAATTVEDVDFVSLHNCAEEAKLLGDQELARVLYLRALGLETTMSRTLTIAGLADSLSALKQMQQADEAFQIALQDKEPDSYARTINLYLDHLYRNNQIEELQPWLLQLRQLMGTSFNAIYVFLINLFTYSEEANLPEQTIVEWLKGAAESLATISLPPHTEHLRPELLASIASHLANSETTDTIGEAAKIYIRAINDGLDDVEAITNLTIDLRTHWGATELAAKIRRALLKRAPDNANLWELLFNALLDVEDAVPPKTMVMLKRATSGSERLQLLDDAVGPLQEDLAALLAQAGAALGDPDSETQSNPDIIEFQPALTAKLSKTLEPEKKAKATLG